jgi:P4 family phage/plasmid primase-like protien
VTAAHVHAALQALKFRYEGVPEDSQIVVNTCYADETGFKTHVYNANQLQRIAEDHAGGQHHVWTRVSTVRPDVTVGAQSRGMESDTYGTCLLHVDLDPDGSEDWRERTLRTLEQFQPAPHGIEDSGRGYYAFWRIGWTTDWHRVKRVNKWLASQLGGDHCFDVARVLRLPGTYNPKAERYAEVVRHSMGIHTLDDFGEAELTKTEIRLEEYDVEPDVLPLNFMHQVQASSPKLWGRIESEETAQNAGAVLRGDRSGVDRSRNDQTIAIQLLRMGCTEGQVFSVLTHPTWFSGSKFRQTRNESYVKITLDRARSVSGGVEITNPVLIGQRILEDEVLLYYLNEWWRYNEERGVFELADRWISTFVQNMAGLKWKAAIEADVRAWLQPHCVISIADIPKQVEITNVRNGMLNWQSGVLEPHAPRFRSMMQVDATWDPGVDTAEVDAFVSTVLPPEAIDLWWQFCGYCLYVDIPLPYRCLLALVGPKRTGKSTLLNALVLFLGSENVSNISLADLTGRGNQFTTSGLVGRMLNVDHDAPYDQAIREVHLLKKLAAGDAIPIEQKGKPATSAEMPVKMVFAMNGYPVAEGADEGFWDRWRVVKVNDQHRFTDDNPKRLVLAHVRLMTQERNRSAWLLRSVEGLQALHRSGGFPTNEVLQGMSDDMRLHSDTIYAFWMTQTDIVPVDVDRPKTVALRTFYNYYVGWARDIGQQPVSQRRFTDHTKELTQEGTLRGTSTIYKSERWCAVGRAMKSEFTINGRAPGEDVTA